MEPLMAIAICSSYLMMNVAVNACSIKCLDDHESAVGARRYDNVTIKLRATCTALIAPAHAEWSSEC
jgi:hypothetical protein